MKKIFLLILTLTLCLALFACGGGGDTCTEHVDADANGKCDNCDAAVEPEGNGGDQGTAGKDLVLVTGSTTGFAVVAADALTDRAEGYVNDFIKNLNK